MLTRQRRELNSAGSLRMHRPRSADDPSAWQPRASAADAALDAAKRGGKGRLMFAPDVPP
jgi:hypothetical protein